MFPNGWPGKGLLVMRLVNGALMIFDGIAALIGAVHREPLALLLTAAVAGAFVVVGLWTPVAGALAAIAELSILILGTDHPRSAIMQIAAGISIGMLGPGVWSVDALLFGRKRLDLHEL
jgi:hypothetical protein